MKSRFVFPVDDFATSPVAALVPVPGSLDRLISQKGAYLARLERLEGLSQGATSDTPAGKRAAAELIMLRAVKAFFDRIEVGQD